MNKYPVKKPLFVFGTRYGTVYNLTPSNMPNIPAIHLSVGDYFDNKEVLKNLPQGMTFKKLFGFNENIKTYLSPYDFYKKECIAGCERTDTIKIRTTKGFTKFKAQDYDEMVTLIDPDILVTFTEYPSEGKGNKNQSNRSIKRAINKTTHYLQNSKLYSTNLQKKIKLAALHGGKNTPLMNRSLEQILNHESDGFVICDLCEGQTFEEREQVYEILIERLKAQDQKDKKYVMALAGLGKLEDISHALKFGIQIFEINYPFILAEQQKALIKTGQQTYTVKQPFKNQNLEPLDKSCFCYTCKNHGQSYIAHLIDCHEMTAKVLLTIHNVHQYMVFLEQFE